MQLVSDRVTVANPGDKTGKPKSGCTAADVVAKFGVRPEQIVDYLSLVGDAVDNIPGVPGVGPKTAAALLARFGNWEGIAAALAGVEPERIRTALAGSAETVERNRKMICLKTGLDLRPEWSELHVRPAKPDRLRECYARWGFRSLLAGLGEPGQGVLL